MNSTMQEFIRLVCAMRAAQKVYFRSRDKDALQKSKQLEKDVDAQLAKFDNELPEFKQLGLWGA